MRKKIKNWHNNYKNIPIEQNQSITKQSEKQTIRCTAAAASTWPVTAAGDCGAACP